MTRFKVNQSQYDSDREAAKISALSSKELVKIQDIYQEQLNKLSLNILHWVKLLIRDQKKKIIKRDLIKWLKWLIKQLKNIQDKSKKQLKMTE